VFFESIAFHIIAMQTILLSCEAR